VTNRDDGDNVLGHITVLGEFVTVVTH